MKEKGLIIVLIVAIVAVVGTLMLTMEITAVTDSDDLVGEAFRGRSIDRGPTPRDYSDIDPNANYQPATDVIQFGSQDPKDPDKRVKEISILGGLIKITMDESVKDKQKEVGCNSDKDCAEGSKCMKDKQNKPGKCVRQVALR